MYPIRGMQYALKMALMQLIIILIIALLIDIAGNLQSATSFFIGGLINVLPNVCFAHMFFKHKGALAAKNIVTSFYLGEATKIALTAILFVLVFWIIDSNPVFVFTGLVVAQLTFWIAPHVFNHY